MVNGPRRYLDLLPSGRALPSDVWEARHRAISLLLWAHLPFLFVLGVVRGHAPLHVLADLQPIIIVATIALVTRWSRGVRSGVTTFGLVACSAVLVHFSGGVIEMHFHFFVVVGIITLYQDWLPFCVAIGFTVVEHGVIGVLAPESVYNHAAAQQNPWLWAAVHGGFVLAASVPHVLAWRQNEDQALRDPLTRLSNRTLLADRLERALAHSERRGSRVAVLFVDLDHFKQVNDTLGHTAGDDLLVTCARRLSSCTRDGDLVSRLGGDEFAIILDGSSALAAEEIAARMLDAISEPTVVSGHEIVMSGSIGIAYGSTGITVAELLRNADLAMYVAKSSGRGRYDVFNGVMHEQAVEKLALDSDLRRAIANDEITVECQPIVEVDGGTMTGVEVLARWRHPERGMVPPNLFIPTAERTGLICTIGEQVFRQACGMARDLGEVDDTLTVTVNVSPAQLVDEQLPATFARTLLEYGVDPKRIVLEVTESVLMEDVDAAAAQLSELKKIGVRVAVDDFGVGHSSLSSLRNLPVDVLKIDKSFVDALPGGADLTRMVVQLGRRLGLDVIAEGVESPEQHEQLRRLGCPKAQGFLFSRPIPPDLLLVGLREGAFLTAAPSTQAAVAAIVAAEPALATRTA